MKKRQPAILLPELGLSAHRTGSLRIPEGRNIAITERVREVIDHPAFQRLRRVRMLGPTHLVYPGAVHTRFEHSLGVYGCVQWYLLELLRTPSFADSATEQDLLTVLAAGLLHDIGHYPFAHSLEALHLKGRDTPRHEEVGGQIIHGEFEHLRGVESIASLLRRRWGVDPERVIRLCTGRLGRRPSKIDRILHSIISSTIDADKMDYLERDSHHMGVPYGRNYDRDRLLAGLTLNQGEDAIAISSKGKVSAEMFVFSRYTMFSEVYWHHTVRAASAMVESALAAFHSRSSLDAADFLTQLLSCNDDEFLAWLCHTTPAGSATQYLVSGMLANQRSLYKRVATFSRVYVEASKQKAYERIYAMESAALYDLTSRLTARLSAVVGRSLHPADVIIDIPPRDKDRLESVEVVYADVSGQRHYPLHQLSRVVAGIQDDFIAVVKKIRIFAEPRLAAELRGRADLEQIIVSEILRN
ncbi:MAG: HD domain-containing protein [Bradymonadaceae bacterium]|nr:HD domain-containing protein [Lujinxingiaceae bacterium]